MDIWYTYKPSGKFNIFSLILLIIFALVWVIVLAFIYSLFNRFDPLLYFQVIGTFVRGFLIAWLMNKLVYIFKVRNKTLVYIIGVLMVLISYYIHWSIYTSFSLNANGSENVWSGSNKMGFTYISTDFVKIISDILGILLNPSLIIQNMKWIFENGMRSFSDTVVKWRVIVGFWIAEFGLVFLYTMLHLSEQVSHPFSEIAGKWMKERTSGKLKMPLDIKSDNDISMLKSELEKWNYNFLKQLKKWSIQMDEYCEIKTYISEQDPEAAYITVDSIYETTNNKWEIVKDAKNIVKYLSIPNILANDLQNEYC